MIERESRLPLLIGVVFALLLHVALVPVWGIGLAKFEPVQPTVPPEEDKSMPAPQELEVGRPNNNVTNLAWIAYDDYKELLARHEIIEQPAIQRLEDPVPDAPIEIDPTPPAPDSKPSEPSGPTGEQADESQAASVPISPVGPVPLPDPTVGGDTPYAPHGPMPRDAPLIVENVVAQPDESSQANSDSQPGSPESAGRPTSAPRAEGEAQPVTIIPGIIKVQPGSVLTADGIEITTIKPRPTITARLSTVPRNPTADIYFNNEGDVTRVDLTRSTGADNWDDPVVTAFEQWEAAGERVDTLEGELKITVELLIRKTR